MKNRYTNRAMVLVALRNSCVSKKHFNQTCEDITDWCFAGKSDKDIRLRMLAIAAAMKRNPVFAIGATKLNTL